MPLSLLADRAAERWPVKSYISIIASLSMGKRPFSRKNCNIFCNLVAFSRFGRQIRGTGGPGGQRFGKGQAPAEGRMPPDGKTPPTDGQRPAGGQPPQDAGDAAAAVYNTATGWRKNAQRSLRAAACLRPEQPTLPHCILCAGMLQYAVANHRRRTFFRQI